MMRIAHKRHEAVNEQRWFSSSCLIRELGPMPLPVPKIDVAVKRIHDDPRPSDKAPNGAL